MAYSLFIQTEAIIEIREAFEWYEEQREGLGFELIEEIEASYQILNNHPERYSYINQQYRRIRTNRFPYIIIFEIEDNNIIVNSVRHIKGEPQ